MDVNDCRKIFLGEKVWPYRPYKICCIVELSTVGEREEYIMNISIFLAIEIETKIKSQEYNFDLN